MFWNERGAQRRLTYRELYDEVARVRRALRAMGIAVGDRVAGFMPNLPETIIAMLATTSLGAIWSSCSPDFGVNGVLDRFGQIQPRVLFCADGYRYSGREIDCLERVTRDRRANSGDRARRRRSVPERRNSRSIVGRFALAECRVARSSRRSPIARAAPHRHSRICRSIIPSTSCTRRARRDCPSAWCTAPAARCFSISRSSCSTPISRATIASSTSRPADG